MIIRSVFSPVLNILSCYVCIHIHINLRKPPKFLPGRSFKILSEFNTMIQTPQCNVNFQQMSHTDTGKRFNNAAIITIK